MSPSQGRGRSRASSDLSVTAEGLTFTNPRLERYGTDFVTEAVSDPRIWQHPTYTVSECAKVFFGYSSHWLRNLEKFDEQAEDGVAGYPTRPAFVLDGRPLALPRSHAGYRIYTLPVIERMAHALRQNARITSEQLNNTLEMVEIQCRIHRYL